MKSFAERGLFAFTFSLSWRWCRAHALNNGFRIGPFGLPLSNNDVIGGQVNALAVDPRNAERDLPRCGRRGACGNARRRCILDAADGHAARPVVTVGTAQSDDVHRCARDRSGQTPNGPTPEPVIQTSPAVSSVRALASSVPSMAAARGRRPRGSESRRLREWRDRASGGQSHPRRAGTAVGGFRSHQRRRIPVSRGRNGLLECDCQRASAIRQRNRHGRRPYQGALYAAFWSQGIFKSNDLSGAQWQQLGNGLRAPASDASRSLSAAARA